MFMQFNQITFLFACMCLAGFAMTHKTVHFNAEFQLMAP